MVLARQLSAYGTLSDRIRYHSIGIGACVERTRGRKAFFPVGNAAFGKQVITGQVASDQDNHNLIANSLLIFQLYLPTDVVLESVFICLGRYQNSQASRCAELRERSFGNQKSGL